MYPRCTRMYLMYQNMIGTPRLSDASYILISYIYCLCYRVIIKSPEMSPQPSPKGSEHAAAPTLRRLGADNRSYLFKSIPAA